VATVALRSPGAVWARSVAGVRVLEGVGLLALIALSLLLRTTELGTHFWIDEGLSVGISSRPLTDIPGTLRLDGSPPLYYLLLHGWMALAGDGVVATHWLSLIFALACIPVAFWAGASLFDRRVAWILAALTALCPFLTSYAQETRMYSLVVLLAITCTAAFVHAYVYERRRWRIPFGVLLAALLYTHNWALFLGAAFAIAAAIAGSATPRGPHRAAFVRDAAVGFGTAGLLFLPWLPTLAFQAQHTGAPWATSPSLETLVHAPDLLLGGDAGTIVVLLAAGTGLAALVARGDRNRRVVVPVVVTLALAPIVVAWVGSQVSPAWASRYLAVAVAPLLLMAAVGLRHAGRLGLIGVALLVVIWLPASAPSSKSNAHYLAERFAPELGPGDLVITTQPEQVPVLSYYLRDARGVTFATPFGVQRDLGVTDWRDGAEHFDRTGVNTQLLPLLDRLPLGADVLLIRPIVWHERRWTAPWTSRVRDRTMEYTGIMRGDPRFELTGIVPDQFRSPGPNPLQGLLFRKVRDSA
jgi:mannosyltransferase